MGLYYFYYILVIAILIIYVLSFVYHRQINFKVDFVQMLRIILIQNIIFLSYLGYLNYSNIKVKKPLLKDLLKNY